MADLPDPAKQKELLADRTEQAGSQEAALEKMFDDLDEAQATIDNRADAIVKLAGFLGGGLAVLGKLDGSHAIKLLSVVVVFGAGVALAGALLSSNHSPHRRTLLLPPCSTDLTDSCNELRRSQRYLAAASILTFGIGVLAVVAVIVSIV